jgi:hypothetical protein
MKKGSWKEKYYNLYGVVVMSSWLGGKGGALIEIETDEQGLKKIKDDPLQDYLSYGAESVDYIHFEVYLTEIEKSLKAVVKKEYINPVDSIEAGKRTEEIEKLIENLYDNYPLPVKLYMKQDLTKIKNYDIIKKI